MARTALNTPMTTLVTGASSGIGLHLARQFAAAGHPLVLVAQHRDELELVRTQIEEEHGVQARCFALDLAAEGAIDRLARELDDTEIDVLVNNAGQGQRGAFVEVPIQTHVHILRTNVEAILRLTAHLLPGMLRRGRGGILNVASIAGYEPGPLLAVYHASKAFVLSWSEALATELAGTRVSVTTLCPGPTDTDFFRKAEMENSRAFQQTNLMAPQEVARIGYEAFVKKERVVVAGLINQAMVAMRHVLPESVQAAKNELFYEDAPPSQRRRERGDLEDRYDERRAGM
jgi:short-subunit dehydrogenase